MLSSNVAVTATLSLCYRVTAERELNVVSNTQHDGFQRLSIETKPNRPQDEKTLAARRNAEEIEYSPFLKIAETRA